MKEKFFKLVKSEIVSTAKIYFEIAKNPFLLAIGFFQVIKDLFYELPKSLIFINSKNNNFKDLHQKASQALALSELATIPGTFLGVIIFNVLNANDYTSSIIGGAIGNYLAGAISYILAYLILTRGNNQYSNSKAIIDALKVVKDCFPTAMFMYLSGAPIISFLLLIGLPQNIAVGLSLALAMAIFTGVAKHSASKKLDKI